MIGPFRGGRTVAASGIPGNTNVFYVAANNGGVWKTTDCGTRLDADLRRPAHGLDRRPGRRAVAPRHALRRERRGPAAARPLRRRRHLQVDGRGEDVDAPRPSRRASRSRRLAVRPARPGPRFRGGPRPPVRPERRARRLPVDGRRQDVGEGPLQGREHGRLGRGVRPVESGRRLRRALGRAAGPVGERRVAGARERPLQDHRRRDHVAAAHEGPAHVRRGPRPHRHLRLAGRSAAPLRHRGRVARKGGHLRLRRRGRELARASTARSASGGAATTSPRCRSHPKNRDERLGREHRDVPVDRRRKDVHRRQGRAGRRRLPHDLDQPGEPRRHPPRERPGRDDHRERRARRGAAGTTSRRRSSTTSPRTTAFRTGSTAGSRRAARSRSRAGATTARSRSATGTPSAPRSTATSRPTRSTPTSSTAGSSRASATRTGDVQDVSPAPVRRQVPVPAHGAGPLLAGRPARPLLRGQRPLQDDERREELGRHQPGSHPRGAGRAGVDRHLPHAGDGEAAAPRRHLHRRARPRRTST